MTKGGKEREKKERKKERKKWEKENQWEGSTEVVLKWKRIRLLLFSSILHPPPNPPHTPLLHPSSVNHPPSAATPPSPPLPSPPLPWPVKLSCMGWNWKAESCFCFKKKEKNCYACFWHSSGPHSLSQLNGAMLIHHHQYVFVKRVQVAVFRAKVLRKASGYNVALGPSLSEAVRPCDLYPNQQNDVPAQHHQARCTHTHTHTHIHLLS